MKPGGSTQAHSNTRSRAQTALSIRSSKLRVRHFMLLALLVEHGSLREAARRLGIAQPAVGALLRELEHAVGQDLFIRSRTGVSPTPAALALAARSDVALETLRIGLDEVAEGTTPTLRVGIVHHAMILHGIPWLTDMLRFASQWQLRVQVSAAPELLENVATGDLDCAIARFPSQNLAGTIHDTCRVWQLPADPWNVVASVGHPALKSRTPVPAETLLAHPWVLPASDSQTYLMFRNACMRSGVPAPAPALVVDGLQYCVAMAMNARLLTICPSSMLRSLPGPRQLKAVRTDFSIEAPPLAFVCRTEAQRLPAIRALLELVLSTALAAKTG